MQYAVEMPFDGNVAKAFETAVAALTSIGFRITSKTATSLELVGPGMTSTRQSALLGATEIRLSARSGGLSLEAELGGVARMARFLAVFPLSLCFFIFVVIVAVAAVTAPGQLAAIAGISAAAVAINVLVWLVLAPLLGRRIHARSCDALDALLNNMAMVAGDD